MKTKYIITIDGDVDGVIYDGFEEVSKDAITYANDGGEIEVYEVKKAYKVKTDYKLVPLSNLS